MAFQDRAQGLCSQLHLTAVRRPVFIGVGVLLGLILIAAGARRFGGASCERG